MCYHHQSVAIFVLQHLGVREAPAFLMVIGREGGKSDVSDCNFRLCCEKSKTVPHVGSPQPAAMHSVPSTTGKGGNRRKSEKAGGIKIKSV